MENSKVWKEVMGFTPETNENLKNILMKQLEKLVRIYKIKGTKELVR